MKILMLVNWSVSKNKKKPEGKQPADFCIDGEPYWFYRHFSCLPQVDIIDVSNNQWVRYIEKEILHVHILQGLKAIPKLKDYDLIVSHGMTSAVVVALWRRFNKTKAKHVVFDIGCFNSASESGIVMKLMQFVSKSIDGIIYHTKSQGNYYKKYYPWLCDVAYFIPFGVDLEFINTIDFNTERPISDKYTICVGSGSLRDKDTLIAALSNVDTNIKILFLGEIIEKYKDLPNVIQIGKVSFTKMINYIDHSEFCVLPLESRNYSYGQMTLLDQMARGKCVVASQVPSFEEYAENDKNILFFEPKNVNDCKQKIEIAIRDLEKRNRIGQNAYRKVEIEINEKMMANNIERLFVNLLNNENWKSLSGGLLEF